MFEQTLRTGLGPSAVERGHSPMFQDGGLQDAALFWRLIQSGVSTRSWRPAHLHVPMSQWTI